MRKSKGITLIALIITIIVLLILAGVTLSILTGENGVLNQAQESKEKTDKARIQEMRELTSARAAMNLDGYYYNYETHQIVESKTSKTIYIPSGFAVSEVTEEIAGKGKGENEVDSGLVIIDKMGDEFVWVPATSSNYVKRATTRYSALGVTDGGVSLGDDYGNNEFLTNNGGETSIVTTAGGFFVSRYEIGLDGTEQRNLTKVSDINYYSKMGVANNYVYTATEKELYWSQANDKQKRAIIDRILPKLQSKKGIEPVRRMTQDECLWLANEWKSGKDHQTGLITGTQWDRMVSWICNAGETGAFADTSSDVLGDCTSWGNYKNNLSKTYKSLFTSGSISGNWVANPDGRRQSGDSYRVIFPTGEFISSTGIDTSKKNIYDVAGNVWECTTEESHNVAQVNGIWPNRVIRGGGADNTGDILPVIFREGSFAGTITNYWALRFSCCALCKTNVTVKLLIS